MAQDRAQPDLVPVDQIRAGALPAIPREPGIYFLLLRDEVVYVGRSKRVGVRIGQHLAGRIEFDRWFFLPCPVDRQAALEAAYIQKFDPKWNIDKPSNRELDVAHLMRDRELERAFALLARTPKKASALPRECSTTELQQQPGGFPSFLPWTGQPDMP